MSERDEALEALKQLLPGLEYSKQTHVQWRDCEQLYRDANPDIGDADFHDRCVREYDERINTINDAIAALDERDRLRDALVSALWEWDQHNEFKGGHYLTGRWLKLARAALQQEESE